MDYYLILSALFLGGFLLLINNIAKKYLFYLEKKEILAFKKIKIKEKVREREDETQENEEIESSYDNEGASIVPTWLIPILEGANIDIDKASAGDKQEIEKLATILLKYVGKPQESGNGEIILS